MTHPVHAILKRIFDIEQYAFDTNTREFWPSSREAWPSERFVQAFVGDRPDGYAAPRASGDDPHEREPEN
jgi:hypothetical protein